METFELLETIRWRPDDGFFLIDRHRRRLERSAAHFGFRCSAAVVDEALERAVSGADRPLRLRLLVARDGSARVEARPLESPARPARIAIAKGPIDPADVFLYHKTTNRRQYDFARREDLDDVVLWNPRREVTETTIANLVVERAGRRLTPPVACGLLAGTFRDHLLEAGEIEEATISLDDLQDGSGLWLVNSVREWWPATLLHA